MINKGFMELHVKVWENLTNILGQLIKEFPINMMTFQTNGKEINIRLADNASMVLYDNDEKKYNFRIRVYINSNHELCFKYGKDEETFDACKEIIMKSFTYSKNEQPSLQNIINEHIKFICYPPPPPKEENSEETEDKKE